MTVPKKEEQVVTAEGAYVRPLIAGVKVRYAVSHPDERGDLTEVYNPAWGIHPDPLVYVICVTLHPGKIRGWLLHHEQDDRWYVSHGVAKFVLYDDRPQSPTYQMINEIYLGNNKRGLLMIPTGVYHAVQNVSPHEAIMINMPSKPYQHSDPDKYRLPLDNDLIPYSFDS